MQVKTDQVFLVQSRDENSVIKQTVIISDNAISAKKCFNQNFDPAMFLGMTSLTEYINVHKNIISSLNGDDNAWPLIVDQNKSE